MSPEHQAQVFSAKTLFGKLLKLESVFGNFLVLRNTELSLKLEIVLRWVESNSLLRYLSFFLPQQPKLLPGHQHKIHWFVTKKLAHFTNA